MTFAFTVSMPYQPVRIANPYKDKYLVRELDKKAYELKDHLGNVRVVVNDHTAPAFAPFGTYSTTFDGSTTEGWAGENSSSVALENDNLKISVTAGSGDMGAAKTISGLTVNTQYKIKLDMDAGTVTDNMYCQLLDGNTQVDLQPLAGGTSEISFIAPATSVTIKLMVETPTAAGYFYLNSFDVFEGSGREANLLSIADYYPFGSLVPQRRYNPTEYRYGFNGMEKDDEIKGTGNSLDFGARIYDPRIARFTSPDPLMTHNATWSPYAYALDNPVMFVDENGEWPGVTYFFFEFDAGAGLGYGLNYVEQSGIAYDEVGKTHFTMTSELYIVNQTNRNMSDNPEIAAGAAASVTAGVTFDGGAETFSQSQRKYNGQFNGIEAYDVVGGGIAFGEGLFTMKAGIGAGIKVSVTNPQIKQSISLTDAQADQVSDATDVVTESWMLNNVTEMTDDEGNITGYSATVSTSNTKGKMIDTGIKVYSGTKTADDGTVQSNGQFTSKAYDKEAAEVE